MGGKDVSPLPLLLADTVEEGNRRGLRDSPAGGAHRLAEYVEFGATYRGHWGKGWKKLHCLEKGGGRIVISGRKLGAWVVKENYTPEIACNWQM